MDFKFSTEKVSKVREDLETEIQQLETLLDEIDDEMKDLDSIWKGNGRDTADIKLKELSNQSKELAKETRKYTQFLDFVLVKHPATDKEILAGLNKI